MVGGVSERICSRHIPGTAELTLDAMFAGLELREVFSSIMVFSVQEKHMQKLRIWQLISLRQSIRVSPLESVTLNTSECVPVHQFVISVYDTTQL